MIYQITCQKLIDFVKYFPSKYGDLGAVIPPSFVAGAFTLALVVRHFLQGKRDIFEPLIKMPETLACVLTLFIIYLITGLAVSGYFKDLGIWFEQTIVKPLQDLINQLFSVIGLAFGLTYDLSIGVGSIITIIAYLFLTPWLGKIVDRLPYRFFTSAVIAILLTLPFTLPCAIACVDIVKAFFSLGIHMFFTVLTIMVIAISAIMDLRRMITKADYVIHTAPIFATGCVTCLWLYKQGYVGFLDIFVIAYTLLVIVYTIVATWAILADRKTLFIRTTIAIASICFLPITTLVMV